MIKAHPVPMRATTTKKVVPFNLFRFQNEIQMARALQRGMTLHAEEEINPSPTARMAQQLQKVKFNGMEEERSHLEGECDPHEVVND